MIAARPRSQWFRPAKTVLSYLWLMRAHASVASAAAVLVAAILLGCPADSTPVILAALVVALITGAGNTLNDYYDYEIDRLNKPGRAIPSGAVSLRAALRFAWTLFAGGIVAALFLNPIAVAIAACNSFLLILYARKSKQWGLAKNLAVAYLVGSVFLFTSAAVGKSNLLVVTLSVCSFLATLSREIVKDIEDLEGDRVLHSKTLPLTIGPKKSHIVAFTVLAGSVMLAVLPFALGMMGVPALVLIGAGALIFWYAYALKSASTAHKYIMVGSLVELGAFLLAGR